MYYNNIALSVSTSNCNISTLSCSVVINNLTPSTHYIIEVSCSTGAGEGPRTNSINVITAIESKLIHIIITWVYILSIKIGVHLNPDI